MTLIALAQTTATGDMAANIKAGLETVRVAAQTGARLLAFPEVFLYVGNKAGKLAAAQSLDGPAVGAFREAAAKHGLTLCLGSVHEAIPGRPDKIHNTSVLIGPDGGLLAAYRKRRLFDIDMPGLRAMESETVVAGEEPPPVVETPVGRVGLAICFDLRFGGHFSQLRRAGAQLVLVPSNFTAPTGQTHWEPLLRARAIENQYWVAAPGQTGRVNPEYDSHGHSMVIDPWGQVVAQAGDAPTLLLAQVDLSQIDQVRQRLPMGQD